MRININLEREYSSKFRSMNTQLTPNGQEISGYWLNACRRSRFNGDAGFWGLISEYRIKVAGFELRVSIFEVSGFHLLDDVHMVQIIKPKIYITNLEGVLLLYDYKILRFAVFL